MTIEAHVLSILLNDPNHLYAIIDCSRRGGIFQWLKSSKLTKESLFSGNTQIMMEEIAPYLIQYKQEDFHLWSELLDQYWATSSLFFISSYRNSDQLRLQLKKCFIAETPTGKEALFRFFDPRAWRSFLPMATSQQVDYIYGDAIDTVHTESQCGEKLFSFDHQKRSVLDKVLGAPHVKLYTHLLIEQIPARLGENLC